MLAYVMNDPPIPAWVSNVCLVKRADGGLGFCIEYRQLKKLTCKVSYPLPRISACLEALVGSRCFSTIDV